MSRALVHAPPYELTARSSARAQLAADLESVPRWRGVSHEKAFAFAPALSLLLVASAAGPRASIAAAVFATTMTLMLGASVATHRVRFSPRSQPWVRRVDHVSVNLFLAGTWMSLALACPSGVWMLAATLAVGAGAIAASLVTIFWVDVPGWIPASIGLGAGWTAVVVLPDLVRTIDSTGTVLFVLGGLFYTCGFVVYALRRPNPFPSSFAYHEVFHALVLGGVACHYAALAFFVFPTTS